MNGIGDSITTLTVADLLARNWWLLALRGLAGVLFGILAFIWPGITALGLLIMIAAWAIVIGIIEIVAAVQLRKVITNEWLLILAGIASVAFGVVLLLYPRAGALVLVWWIGAYALVFGILLMILAFRLRRTFGSFAHAQPRTA